MATAFGLDNSYFLYAPPRYHGHGLPPGLQAVLSSENPPRLIYQVSLGPNDSWFMAYQSKDGANHIRYKGIPQSLEKWLIPGSGNVVVRKIDQLAVGLGPGGSYFAFDKKSATWGNLPAEMAMEIASRLDKKGEFLIGKFPQSVAFGPDGSFVFLMKGGRGFWSSNLCSQNRELTQWLRDTKSYKGWYITLSPDQPGVYMLLHKTGAIRSALPPGLHAPFNAFSADLKVLLQQIEAKHRQNRAALARKAVGIGFKVLGAVVGAALGSAASNNTNGNLAGGGGGGGGGGFSAPSFQGGGMDMSTFWSPLQSAAQDPIMG